MSTIKSIHIIINGVVQGVGFRPFVSNLANSLGIKGKVCNSGGIVEVFAEGDNEILSEFVKLLKEDAPLNSNINSINTEQAEYQGYTDFVIVASKDSNGEESPYIPPDLPICDDCLKEMKTMENRRYEHPFISCASCGPRYSIIDRLPYDRCNTAMQDFEMCKPCSDEYTNSNDRRYHAQTLSCHECGQFLIYKTDNEILYREKAFEKAVEELKNGGIVAIKGIGGYHFACSPFDSNAVDNLRKLKIREEKPFAVMFLNTVVLQDYCRVSESEKDLLKSPARPIVLLERKDSDIYKGVYKDSCFLGTFLPYTALHFMLLEKCGPLIMTSGNLSGLPIIKDNNEILSIKSEYLNGVLYNERDIRIGLDDSVAHVVDGNVQVLRFSRGYAPLPVILNNNKSDALLACGGDLKSSFCLYNKGMAYLSQFIGDLETEQIYEAYKGTVEHLKKLLQVTPKAVICDLHPNYYSTSYAKKLGLPIMQVQHHYAHIASVMAEHDLTDKVIGVAFDGTGYGDDGAVWGGEFFVCDKSGYERLGHLEYTAMTGGDSLAKDNLKCAYAHLYASGLESQDDNFKLIKAAIDNNINTVNSSSMGRLFDSVSCILGLCNFNKYEGQSAIILENVANEAKIRGMEPYPLKFEIEDYNIKSSTIIKGIVEGLNKKIPVEQLALGFHEAVACMVLEMCIKIRNENGINKVCLSGGVFQNIVLIERCLELLKDFEVYYNKFVPPNDGGIALGQAYIGANIGG